jgi:hypothetical protein
MTLETQASNQAIKIPFVSRVVISAHRLNKIFGNFVFNGLKVL